MPKMQLPRPLTSRKFFLKEKIDLGLPLRNFLYLFSSNLFTFEKLKKKLQERRFVSGKELDCRHYEDVKRRA